MAVNRQVTTVEDLIADIALIKVEIPHTAVIASNDQYKTKFFNVYYRSEIEPWLDTVDIPELTCYAFIPLFVRDGYTVKVLPTNDQGFAQCTVSVKELGKTPYTCCLTGTGGKPHNAILSAYIKHSLILDEMGFWHGTTKPLQSDRRFS